MITAPWRKSSHSESNGHCVEATAFRKSSYSTANGECVEAGEFRKSSHSHANGNCVEAGEFRASSHSGIAQGQCVETGQTAAGVAVRDSKQRAGCQDVLMFSAAAWQRFTAGIKEG